MFYRLETSERNVKKHLAHITHIENNINKRLVGMEEILQKILLETRHPSE